MSVEDRHRWNSRYTEAEIWQRPHNPFPWLVEQVDCLSGGLALDIACGLGHNVMWLAQHGYKVIGVDGSRVALVRAWQGLCQTNFENHALLAESDLDNFRPPPQAFDLICMIRFLSRDLFPWLVRALKPGGLLMIATLNWRFAQENPDTPRQYLLNPDELRLAFPALHLEQYQEEEDMSYLRARKPISQC